ncbi:reverse transcriptase domain-containing protein [Tanacetum coccineum]
MSRIREQAILRARSNSGRRLGLGPVLLEKTQSNEDIEEVFTISHERPDQYVTMGATLTTNCKQLLADILRENIEVFAWTGSKSTAIPRFVMEHQLKIYPLTEPVVHKRGPVAPEGRLALKERLANGTWKVQMDYSSLNKACSKDMYPFLEEGEELTSLMGYPYKSISKFIPKLAELKNPLREARTRMETAKEAGWTNEAEEALRRIKRKLGKMETISSALLIEREGIQIPVSYVSRPLQGMEICYTPTEKRVQALIHTTRSLRTIFRKQMVKVVTDGPIEEILKLSGKEGRLAKWAAEIHTYDISYIPKKEAEGLVMKKFFDQGEQVEGTPDANKE